MDRYFQCQCQALIPGYIIILAEADVKDIRFIFARLSINRNILIEKNHFTGHETAVRLGLFKEQTEQQVNEYLDELAFLAETAGAGKPLNDLRRNFSTPTAHLCRQGQTGKRSNNISSEKSQYQHRHF